MKAEGKTGNLSPGIGLLNVKCQKSDFVLEEEGKMLGIVWY